MRQLVCRAGSCAHNTNGHCNARTIEMRNNTGETFCNTYVHEDKYLDDKYAKSPLNAFKVEFGEEGFASPKIVCAVSQCAYNKSFKCKANDVEVDEVHSGDVCNCLRFRQK